MVYISFLSSHEVASFTLLEVSWREHICMRNRSSRQTTVSRSPHKTSLRRGIGGCSASRLFFACDKPHFQTIFRKSAVGVNGHVRSFLDYAEVNPLGGDLFHAARGTGHHPSLNCQLHRVGRRGHRECQPESVPKRCSYCICRAGVRCCTTNT